VTSIRKQQAASTRAAIIAAARGQMERRGYESARVEDIAAAAGVAVPTVYKIFLSKRRLLACVVEAAMSGAIDASVPEQDWWREQISESSAPRQLELIARNARQIYDRAGRLLEQIQSAVGRDPEVDAAARRLDDERFVRSELSAKALAGKAALRTGVGVEEAATTLWSLTAPELYLLQVKRRGLSSDVYESWLGSILKRSLLPC
jgi:AcrR family transcriptional regulator